MTSIDGPLSHAIGLAVLHLLWQGTLIALVLAIALKIVSRSRANLRYVMSLAALGAFLAFGVFTAVQSYEAVDGVFIVPNDAVVVSLGDGFAASEAPQPGFAGSVIGAVQTHSSTIAIVWLAGVAALALKLTISWTRARGLTSFGTRPAPQETHQALERLAKRLGVKRAVRLLESVAVDVPSVVGFLKPVILVPASSLSGLSARQLELILAHELAHIRRHDFLVNTLQSVAETLLFYHPAAWWVSRQVRIERENCCDDLAVATCGNAIELARALTTLEGLRGSTAIAMAANGGSLVERVRRLVTRGDGRSVNGWTAVAAAITFAVVMTITSLPVHADREPAAPPPPDPPAEIEVVAAPEPPEPAPAPEAPEAPEPEDEELEEEEIEYDDEDLTPMVLPTPVVAPRVVIAPRPMRTPVAPRAPLAALAYLDADMDHDDDQEEKSQRDSSGRLSIDELIGLRIHGVTPQYISEMRALFGNSLSMRQVTSLKVMNVTPKYVADLRAAGVEIKTSRDALALATHGVTVEWIRQLAAAGYTKLTARELARLAAAGVDANFIRDMQKYRTNP